MQQILHQMRVPEIAGIIKQGHVWLAIEAYYPPLRVWAVEAGFTLHQQPVNSTVPGQKGRDKSKITYVLCMYVYKYNPCITSMLLYIDIYVCIIIDI